MAAKPNQTFDSITYKEVLEHLYAISLATHTNVTESSQKEVILNFICEKMCLKRENIPQDDLIELNSTVTNFFSRFVQKYREKFRKIKMVLSDPWAANTLNISHSILALSSLERHSCEMDLDSSFSEEDEKQASNLNSKSRTFTGKKRKSFDEKKPRAQMKESAEVREKHSPG